MGKLSMSLLRRLRRKHRFGRSKTHTTVGLHKSTNSNEYAFSRDRFTTQQAPVEHTVNSLSRAGGIDRLPPVRSPTEESTYNGQRKSPLSEAPWDWLLTARIASYVSATTVAIVAGNSAVFGFTILFAMVCDMFMCKLHRRKPVTLPSAKDDRVSRENSKSSVVVDQNCLSGQFVSVGNSDSLVGVSAMDFQSRIDNVTPKKDRRSYALDSVRVSSETVPSEDCTGSSADSSSGKLRTRFKSKSLLKHLRNIEPVSAPSSPMGSSHDKSPFSDAEIICDAALKRPVVRGKLGCSADGSPPHLLSDQEVGHTVINRNERQLAKPLSSSNVERQRKRLAKIRSIWTALGLLIVMGGLFRGRMIATMGLISWWLLLSKVSRQLGV